MFFQQNRPRSYQKNPRSATVCISLTLLYRINQIYGYRWNNFQKDFEVFVELFLTSFFNNFSMYSITILEWTQLVHSVWVIHLDFRLRARKPWRSVFEQCKDGCHLCFSEHWAFLDKKPTLFRSCSSSYKYLQSH